MDKLIYNICGYCSPKLYNDSAKIIQKNYRIHRNYEIKWRLDILFKKKKNLNKDINDDYEELEYWNSLRNKIKYNSEWVFL